MLVIELTIGGFKHEQFTPNHCLNSRAPDEVLEHHLEAGMFSL